jgi:hypothetical protein
VRAVEPDSDRRIQVVPLGEDRGDEVAALMGRAFQDDPLFVHACPDPGDRARWLPWMFRWSAWKGFLFGQTLGTAGRLAAPTVLLTYQPTNLPIYDRYGYVVVCQRTTRSGPRWWGLRRNPGT